MIFVFLTRIKDFQSPALRMYKNDITLTQKAVFRISSIILSDQDLQHLPSFNTLKKKNIKAMTHNAFWDVQSLSEVGQNQLKLPHREVA